MGFIIATRKPTNNRPVMIVDSDRDELPEEFKTKAAADEWAKHSKLCREWGYVVLELPDWIERRPGAGV